METSKQPLKNYPEIKIDERLNLGLDADQSSDEQNNQHNSDNDQVSGNGSIQVYSPLDDK
ncbi:hypothetical protein [Pedobacter sp. JCM 36344]|uniref:hypothetical protein n=1 Tax=Pedobacter sp. JCM 36344 TaxID=3374280 RepID=UPI00397BAF01